MKLEATSMSTRFALFSIGLCVAGQLAFSQQPKVLTRTPAESWWPRENMALAQIVAGDGTWSASSLANAARPKDLLVFWGTGFRSGAELEVIVGMQPARVLYAGPSGCCADLDQVVIETPLAVEGCFVPVWFRLAGGQIDQVSIAISPAGGRCRDLAPDVVDKLDAEKALNMGFVSVTTGVAAFGRVPFLGPAPMGTCRLGGVPPDNIEFSWGDFNRDAVAGAINVFGPNGQSVWPWSLWGGMYLRDDYGRTPVTRAPAGEYTVDNGEGTVHFRSFKVAFRVPAVDFLWKNQSSLTHLRRSEGVRVTWDGGDPSYGCVVIFGERFTCLRGCTEGWLRTPTIRSGRVTSPLRLTVAFQSDSKQLKLTIPELDIAFASYYVGSTQIVEIE